MIHIKADVSLIPADVLAAAEAAKAQLEQLPEMERAQFIKDNSAIWRAFSAHLAKMSHHKCWYSESPEPQSFCDVDHFRPKSEAKRSDDQTDVPGYQWLAFCWENYRYSANRSNRLNRNPETGEIEGKGSWFPLLPGSAIAKWDDRCEAREHPVLLDPVKKSDVLLVDVGTDGRVVPSQFAKGSAIHRVERSRILLGLNLPEIVQARAKVIREMAELTEHLSDLLETADDPETPHRTVDRLSIPRLCALIAERTHESSPYAKAARSAVERAGFGKLCSV